MRDTIDMAREAGAHPSHNPDLWDIWEVSNEALNRLVALVRADEREMCAKVADLVAREIDDTNGTATYIATAIRNRGNT
jgi:hypothetical protein